MNNEEWQIICKFRENFKKKIEEWVNFCKKNQIDLCNLINKSAIFDETIVFNIAQLLSYKDERKPFIPFTYKRHTIFFGENLAETYIGIAPDGARGCLQ